MLNKKAIAAFAAGATLLSGLAFAAPAFVSAPAFAAGETAKAKSFDDQLKAAQEAKDKAEKELNDAKAEAADDSKKASEAYKADAVLAKVVSADGKTVQSGYKKDNANQYKVVKDNSNSAADAEANATAATTYLTNYVKPLDEANDKVSKKNEAYRNAAADLTALTDKLESAKKNLEDAKKAVEDAQAAVDKAFPPYAKAYRAHKQANKKLKAVKYELSTLNANTPDDQKQTDAYNSKAHAIQLKIDAAEAAVSAAFADMNDAQAKYDAAVADYGTVVSADGSVSYTGKLGDYAKAYKAAKAVKEDLVKGYPHASAFTLKGDHNLDFASLPGEGGQGEGGQGGQGEGGQGDKGHGDKGHGDEPGKPGALPNAAQASANLMHAQVVLQDAAATKTKTVKDSNDAKAALDKAQAQYDALFAQFKAASDNYQNNFVLTGKADTDAGKAAKADVDAAKALVDAYGSNELANAKKDYAEKSGKALVASLAFNKAKEEYRLAYNVALRVEASAVKGFQDPKTIADAPLDFPAATAAAKAEAGKLAAAAAQAGKAADAAAAGAHGAKAAAGENGGKKKNNAGEDAKKKLGQTGATVALAAVAASVLAGVGAALRKIRH